MLPKISAFFVTFIANAAAGLAIFFFLLVAMNGYSESDAAYGIGTFVALAVLVTAAASTMALLVVPLLIKRGFGVIVAPLISIIVFSLAGAGVKVLCGVVGVIVAEAVRVNF